MNFLRLCLVALLVVPFLSSCIERAGAAGESLTNRQRSEVVQLLRNELKRDPSILRDAIVALQADNERIQATAAADAIARNHDALISPADPAAGSVHPGTTIVEFYDLRCPYCRQLDPALRRFVARDGRTVVVYKDLPILGPASVLGARAVLAAARQGRYAGLRNALMRESEDYTIRSILQVARRLGLDVARLERDMSDPAIQRQLDANARLARRLGIDGTPTLVVGKSLLEGPDISQVSAAVSALRRSSDAPPRTRGLISHPNV